MKSVYLSVADNLVQLSISDGLYADADEGLAGDENYMEVIRPYLSMLCTYTLAVLDYEESNSKSSKYILDNIEERAVVVAIASLWRYNSKECIEQDALLTIPFDEEKKRLIAESRGLVKEFHYANIEGPVEAHKIISFGLPQSAIN
ncbi:hypothetical protein HHL08_20535 [Sphingobium sp. AR-3-1]|uniref:Uncharacterized protein n=1 Tax=Sphingobium psychrophilum TaxID=2728834 RepID=A0A7X9WYZ0_9SPHN|nr:hypothetical protein [Sphingobium psychrophilum]NML12492.1 hypothetical protein [Sphingobium psychrophilum]